MRLTLCLSISVCSLFAPLLGCSGTAERHVDDGTGGSVAEEHDHDDTSSSGSGCGGGCHDDDDYEEHDDHDDGDCFGDGDCADGQYCAMHDCTQGICSPKPADCHAAAPEPVCGCDGVTYESACVAAQAGRSTKLFAAECQPAPAGQFPCGAGFCAAGTEYCHVDASGQATCQAQPDGCEASDCPCLMDATGCYECGFKGDGLYVDQCQG